MQPGLSGADPPGKAISPRLGLELARGGVEKLLQLEALRRLVLVRL